MRNRALPLLFLLFSAPALAQVGGKPLTEGSPLASSLLRFQRKAGELAAECTATLIAPKVALTARHCRGNEHLVLPAAAGAPCGETAVVGQYYEGAPDDTEFGDTPDILLLRLKDPICGAKPLPLSTAPVPVGTRLENAAYAHDSFSPTAATISLHVLPKDEALLRRELGPQDEAVLHSIRLPSFFLDDVIKNLLRRDHFVLALPEDGAATCKGDSGGPVYTEDGLVGVVHGSLPSTGKGSPACRYSHLHYFAPIAPELAWISKKIEEWK